MLNFFNNNLNSAQSIYFLSNLQFVVKQTSQHGRQVVKWINGLRIYKRYQATLRKVSTWMGDHAEYWYIFGSQPLTFSRLNKGWNPYQKAY